MGIDLSQDELRSLLDTTNLRVEPKLREVINAVNDNSSIRKDIRNFIENLHHKGYDHALRPDAKRYNEGANALLKILQMHPVFHSGEVFPVGLSVFGRSDPGNVVEVEHRRDAADLMASGFIALGHLNISYDRPIMTLMQIALGADDLSRFIKSIILDRMPSDWPPPKDPLDPLSDIFHHHYSLSDLQKEMDIIEKKTCGLAIEHAGNSFSGALGIELEADDNLKKHPLQYMSFTKSSITAIVPNIGCPKEHVTIQGDFPITRPENVYVVFPKYGGGCILVPAENIIEWDDNHVKVIVPKGVGAGCVGFVEKIGDWEPSFSNLVSASENLAGTMENCLGMGASAAANNIRNVGNFHAPNPQVPCPECLEKMQNYFQGGPPIIKLFTVDNNVDFCELKTGQQSSVKWEVDNATKVDISTVDSGQQLTDLPMLSLSPPLSNMGSQNFTPSNFAWIAYYELTAKNACGEVKSRILVKLPHAIPPRPTINDFLWGVATSALQVEGNLTLNDWDVFANSAAITNRVYALGTNVGASIHIVPARQATGHWTLDIFKADLLRAKALGINTYRLSIEWSRIQPNPPEWVVLAHAARQNYHDAEKKYETSFDSKNKQHKKFMDEMLEYQAEAIDLETRPAGPNDKNFDLAALGHYKDMIKAIREKGLIPIVTLNHLTLPKWVLTPPEASALFNLGAVEDRAFLDSLRGWENPVTLKAFDVFVSALIPEFPEVDYWITFNEPVGSIMGAGYIGGIWPPGFLGDPNKARAVMRNLIAAHVRAFDIIKNLRPTARVGIAHAMMFFKKTNFHPDTGGIHSAARSQLDYVFNDYFLNAVVLGNIDNDYNHRMPVNNNTSRVDGIPLADWTPKLDFIGINYYRSAYVRHDIPLAIKTGNVFGGMYDNDMFTSWDRHNLLNDLGWEIDPEGLHSLLKRLHDVYMLPILITENGMPEKQDRNRAPYILSHLEQMLLAKSEGVDVIGYIHWSIVDNWEWHEGYRPEARFGLFTIPGLDGSNANLPREITEGAIALQHMIAANSTFSPTSGIKRSTDRFGNISPMGETVTTPILSAGAIWEGYLELPNGATSITLYLSRLGRHRLLGMIFYHSQRIWIRLTDVQWDATKKSLHFSHVKSNGTPTFPTRFFDVTFVNGEMCGTVIEEGQSGHTFSINHWFARKNALHGVWNKVSSTASGPFDITSLMFNVFEGTVKSKCLPTSSTNGWWSFDTVSVDSNGNFTLLILPWMHILNITGKVSGNTITASVTPLVGQTFTWTATRANDTILF